MAKTESELELMNTISEILAAGIASIGGPSQRPPADNEARLSALIATIIDGETLADGLETWTERDPDDRHDPVTDMPAVAAWLADYLAQELAEKGGIVAEARSTLLLPSEDGQEYARPIQYPSHWGPAKAAEEAIAAFTEAQRARPDDDWCWDEDYEAALTRRGFTIPCWTVGPTWDRLR